MSALPVIELVDVGKTYRSGSLEVEALRGISLTIDEGEFVAVVGPSGSGKSTLMHILGCLDTPTRGQFHLAGEDVASLDENQLADVRNRHIGFVFQQFNLLAYLSAWRNVELPLVYAGIDRHERRERALAALDQVGLADRAGHKPGELSGGQQQRVAVARALVTEPVLILADEPTGNLDSVSTDDALALLADLHATGRTIVLITHEHEVAQKAGRTIQIRDGRVWTPEPALTVAGSPVVTWRDLVRTATEAVRTHRLRSALTMLGILIGITAVILTVGLGNGAKAQVRDQIDELGTNLLVVSPGSTTDSSTGVRGGFGTSSTLTVQDADALASSTVAPDIQAVAATAASSASLTNGSTNWTTTLTGTTESWQEVRSREVTTGRFLSQADEDDAAAVVVLGPDTADELFPNGGAVGSEVTYDGTTLTVIGVLEELSSSEETTNNDLAIVPASTYSQRLVGGTSRDSVSSIYVKATSEATLSAAYQEAESTLLNLHGITAATDADFTIATQESILTAATSVDKTMTVMLGGIAVISLLVGGIGVMNIMLVSVTERIREIGLRKALGARPTFIRRQFLVEASVLGLAGGLLGVGFGLVGAVVLPHVTDTRVVLSLTASVAAIAMAIGIGVLFGVYPASRAARLAPIDALRNE
ncbi:ABC transporter permease [Aquihabitans sp. G128]|uniref:ABC transporter permease n=1 Tax=Aquihabitans sp. G128 TaxID=2849779 RepID=UPI001C217163|nr:ABC transporter permease [Aquihabitans sp. G128]QXC61031.1 ABC transporter permease [Aquihabitans sp. G128]